MFRHYYEVSRIAWDDNYYYTHNYRVCGGCGQNISGCGQDTTVCVQVSVLLANTDYPNWRIAVEVSM